MVDIFVSYASADRERVAPLAQVLAARGWTIWWDRQIAPGKTFDEVIEEALEEALAVICVWTQAGVASRWVRTEASEGAARSILVPVLMEDVQIPLAFRRIQAADLTDWEPGQEHAGLEELMSALDELITAGSPAEPTTDSEDSVERAVLAARTRAFERDWEGVIALLAPFEAESQESTEENEDMRELLVLARRKHEAAELYEEAELLYTENRWHEVVAQFERILELDPDFEYGTDLKLRAEGRLEEQRKRRLTEEYERASAALQARQWSVAVARFEQLEVEEPDYRDGPARLEAARRGAKSQSQYEALKQLYDQERSDEVIAGMTELSREDGAFGDPDELLARAQAQLGEETGRVPDESVAPSAQSLTETAPEQTARVATTGDTEPSSAPVTAETAPAVAAGADSVGPSSLENLRRTVPTWLLGVVAIASAYLPWLTPDGGGMVNSLNIPLSFLWSSDIWGAWPIMLALPILVLGLVITITGGRAKFNVLRRSVGIGLIAIVLLYAYAGQRAFPVTELARSIGPWTLLAAGVASALPDPLLLTSRGASPKPGPIAGSRVFALATAAFGAVLLLLALPLSWIFETNNAFAVSAGAAFGIAVDTRGWTWIVSMGALLLVILASTLVTSRIRHTDIALAPPLVGAVVFWAVAGFGLAVAGRSGLEGTNAVEFTTNIVDGGFWVALLGAIVLLLAVLAARWIAGLSASD